MGEFINIACSIYVDPVNATTESLLQAAREIAVLEKQIAVAKAQLSTPLANRRGDIDDVLVELLPTI